MNAEGPLFPSSEENPEEKIIQSPETMELTPTQPTEDTVLPPTSAAEKYGLQLDEMRRLGGQALAAHEAFTEMKLQIAAALSARRLETDALALRLGQLLPGADENPEDESAKISYLECLRLGHYLLNQALDDFTTTRALEQVFRFHTQD